MPDSTDVGDKTDNEKTQNGDDGNTTSAGNDPNGAKGKQPGKKSLKNDRGRAWQFAPIIGIILALCLWFPPYPLWKNAIATVGLIAAIVFAVYAFLRQKRRLLPVPDSPSATPLPSGTPQADPPSVTPSTAVLSATPQLADAFLESHVQTLQKACAQLIAVPTSQNSFGNRTAEERLRHAGTEVSNAVTSTQQMLQELNRDLRDRLTQQFRAAEQTLSQEGFSTATNAEGYIRNIDLMDKSLNGLLTNILQERDQYKTTDERSKRERDHYKQVAEQSSLDRDRYQKMAEESSKERDQYRAADERSKRERDHYKQLAEQSSLDRDRYQKMAEESSKERDQFKVTAGKLDNLLRDLLTTTGAALPAAGQDDALASVTASCRAQFQEAISSLQEFAVICGVTAEGVGLTGLVSNAQACRTALESQWLMAARLRLLDEAAVLARLATMSSMALKLVPEGVPTGFEVLTDLNIASAFASDRAVMEALKLTRRQMKEEEPVRIVLRDWLIQNWWYPCSSALRLASHWRSPLVADTISPESLQTLERLAWALTSLFQMTGILPMQIMPFHTELDRSLHQIAPNDLFSSAEMIERLKTEADSGRLTENTIFQVLQWGYTCPNEEVPVQMASVDVYWLTSYKALFGVEPPNKPAAGEQQSSVTQG